MSETAAKAPADGFVSTFPATCFDAILVVSFGGPEGMDDVIPFLENVTRGRNVPRERLEEVAAALRAFRRRQPDQRQNRELIAALELELDAHGIDLPIYFGNRNWHPLLPTRCAGWRGRRRAGDGVLHVGVQLVLGLPAVPREHLRRPAAVGRTRPRC